MLAGRSLEEALTELQARGLRVLFSDRVVDPAMRVQTEPRDRPLTEVLRQLLEPHQLEARPGASGWLVVVRSPASRPGAGASPEPAGKDADRTAQAVRVSEVVLVRPRLQVPVSVLAGDEPVRGLTIADFELLLGGKRQEILDLEVLDLSSGSEEVGASATAVPTAARRHFLLVFDTGLEGPGSLSRGRTIALRLVDDVLHRTDLVGLATLSEARRPHLALGFTSDRSATESSIDIVTGRSVTEVVTDPLGLRLRPAHSVASRRTDLVTVERAVPNVAKRALTTRSSKDEFNDGADLELQAQRTDRQAAVTRLLGLSDSLTELARTLRYAPGRKHVVLLSEGFDDSMLVGLGGSSRLERERIEVMNRAAESGEIWKIDTDQRYGNEAAQRSFDRMLSEFARSNSVIHAINTRVEADRAQAGSRSRDGLALLASGTGGVYLPSSGDIDGVLASLRRSTAVTYVLSVAPPSTVSRERAGKLRVRLRDGISGRIVHPPLLFDPAASSAPSPEERRLFVGSRIIGGDPGGDFTSTLRVGRPTSEGDFWSIPVSVIAPVELLAVARSEPAAEVYVYALTADGAVGDYFAQSISLADTELEEAYRRPHFRVASQLQLAPGSYEIRSLIVLPRTGASSLASARCEIAAR